MAPHHLFPIRNITSPKAPIQSPTLLPPKKQRLLDKKIVLGNWVEAYDTPYTTPPSGSENLGSGSIMSGEEEPGVSDVNLVIFVSDHFELYSNLIRDIL